MDSRSTKKENGGRNHRFGGTLGAEDRIEGLSPNRSGKNWLMQEFEDELDPLPRGKSLLHPQPMRTGTHHPQPMKIDFFTLIIF
jgi:hypothetical protein